MRSFLGTNYVDLGLCKRHTMRIEKKFDKLMSRSYLLLTIGFTIICCLMGDILNSYLIASVALLILAGFFRFSISATVKFQVTYFSAWFSLCWLYITINAVWISDQSFGWKSILVYLFPALIIMFYFSPFKDKYILETIFCKSCEIGTVIFLGYICINELPSILSGGSRIGWSASGNVNNVAMNLSFFLMVIYYDIIFNQKKRLWVLFVACALFILLTGSKKGLVGILCSIVLISSFKYKWRAYKYFIPLILICLTIYVLRNSQYLYDIVGRRIDDFIFSLETSQSYGSTGERIGMIELGWKIFLRNPGFGNGYGFFSNNTSYGTYSHNNYIEMLVSFGLVGTLLYYSLFYKLIFCGLRKIKDDCSPILFICLLIMQLAFDFASVNFYNNAMMYVILYFSYKVILAK